MKLFYYSRKYFSGSNLKKGTNQVCFYKILNLPSTANQDDIKKEYYKLAKKYHPDNNPKSSQNQTVFFIILFIRKNLNKFQKLMRC